MPWCGQGLSLSPLPFQATPSWLFWPTVQRKDCLDGSLLSPLLVLLHTFSFGHLISPPNFNSLIQIKLGWHPSMSWIFPSVPHPQLQLFLDHAKCVRCHYLNNSKYHISKSSSFLSPPHPKSNISPSCSNLAASPSTSSTRSKSWSLIYSSPWHQHCTHSVRYLMLSVQS